MNQNQMTALRAAALSDQLTAAEADGRRIVGPPREPGRGLIAAAAQLIHRVNTSQVEMCDHLDLAAPTLAWWTPDNPGQVTCQPCHDVERGAPRCHSCTRTTRPAAVRHLIPATPPSTADDHHLQAWPPVVVEVWLCRRCRHPGRGVRIASTSRSSTADGGDT